MIYFVSLTVFSSIILLLVVLLLLVEAKVVKKDDCAIVINNDEEKSLKIPGGSTLLNALSTNNIFIPSACGGGGSCGTCKCVVEEGGRSILPTELAHLTRKERNSNVRLSCQVKVKQDLKIRLPEEIFSVKKYNAVVVSNENVATFIKELVLDIDEDASIDFEAGAYIQIDIPEYELSFTEFRARVAERFRPDWDRFNFWGLRSKTDEPIYRAYSLANPPSEKKRLIFTVRIATPPPWASGAPPGAGSSYLFNLKTGDRTTLSGPYGEFMAKETEREMCYIGGGAGMAPLRSHILHQLETLNTKRKITFWYGARSRQELFYEDEFGALEKKHGNFLFHIALSQPMPEDRWEGMTGFIHNCAHDDYLGNHQDPTEVEYYLCGPPVMIDAVVKMLDDLGVEPEMISFDKFS